MDDTPATFNMSAGRFMMSYPHAAHTQSIPNYGTRGVHTTVSPSVSSSASSYSLRDGANKSSNAHSPAQSSSGSQPPQASYRCSLTTLADAESAHTERLMREVDECLERGEEWDGPVTDAERLPYVELLVDAITHADDDDEKKIAENYTPDEAGDLNCDMEHVEFVAWKLVEMMCIRQFRIQLVPDGFTSFKKWDGSNSFQERFNIIERACATDFRVCNQLLAPAYFLRFAQNPERELKQKGANRRGNVSKGIDLKLAMSMKKKERKGASEESSDTEKTFPDLEAGDGPRKRPRAGPEPKQLTAQVPNKSLSIPGAPPAKVKKASTISGQHIRRRLQDRRPTLNYAPLHDRTSPQELHAPETMHHDMRQMSRSSFGMMNPADPPNAPYHDQGHHLGNRFEHTFHPQYHQGINHMKNNQSYNPTAGTVHPAMHGQTQHVLGAQAQRDPNQGHVHRGSPFQNFFNAPQQPCQPEHVWIQANGLHKAYAGAVSYDGHGAASFVTAPGPRWTRQ